MSNARKPTEIVIRLDGGGRELSRSMDPNTDVYVRMEQLALAAAVVAEDIKQLTPMDPRTIALIRRCKELASDIEMEIFTRRGR